nr:immunoglobulin heavy chain junction region [Macaca mulatta]MOY22373.1 immunoglobulin heavy chain junction region [Macaca mulatta]MOY23767.1 immunoglobulin heavy chain junction region [Macaca mulatta]MOY26040.1 immunoglobulin heavy chain junction region [Macaca mulatta]MOY26688.1 immunoglobulin heavy chain junction region [Macaca mulatta]
CATMGGSFSYGSSRFDNW